MIFRPNIANVSMPLANTEYSYALPASTTKFIIKLRSVNTALQLCFINGDSNTTYLTVPAGESYEEKDIKGKGNIFYFRTAATNQVAEIISWI